MKHPQKKPSPKPNQRSLPDAGALEQSVTLFKSLANPHRLIILLLLNKGEQDVGHIQKALNISQPLASQHLRALKRCNLLSERRDGKHVFYSLRSKGLNKALMSFIQLQAVEMATETETLSALNEFLVHWVL